MFASRGLTKNAGRENADQADVYVRIPSKSCNTKLQNQVVYDE